MQVVADWSEIIFLSCIYFFLCFVTSLDDLLLNSGHLCGSIPSVVLENLRAAAPPLVLCSINFVLIQQRECFKIFQSP